MDMITAAYGDVLRALGNGEYDDDLPQLMRAVSQRIDVVRAQRADANKRALRVGGRGVLRGFTSYPDINNSTVTVTAIRRTRCDVRLDDGRGFTVPLHGVEPL